MTPTAKELLNDPIFLEKRIWQQIEYMQRYKNYVTLVFDTNKSYYADRQREVLLSANAQLAFYRDLREKLLMDDSLSK
jgi:hypothetical protein